MASGTFYPIAGSDDGMFRVGGFYSAYNFLYFGASGPSYNSFVRFPNVNIPQGSTITDAYVKLTSYDNQSVTECNANVYFNDIDNAVSPINESQAFGLDLTGSVAWDNIAGWVDGSQYNTPELKTILQTIINRAGWSSGNAIQVVIKNNASDAGADRHISSFEYSEKAELHVTWEVWSGEITLPNPFSATTSLQSNIQVELVPGILQSESFMSASLFWGSFVECPSPFEITASLQTKTGLEIAINPLIAQTNLQSNIQIELVIPDFTAQSELSVGEIFWGYEIDFPEPFSAATLLQANTQIELVTVPLIATSALLGNIGIEISAGVLNNTGSISGTPIYPIIFTGAKRIYIFTLTGAADGVEDIVIPIKSFQSRLKSGDPTYLSVVVPGTDYASAINLRLNGDLIVRMGYLSNGEIILAEIISMVNFENIIIYNGTTNKTITLDGHRTETFISKEINLTGSSYKNLTAGKLRYRCTPNLYVRPGDKVNIDDDSFTIKNITYSVSPELETFEVSE